MSGHFDERQLLFDEQYHSAYVTPASIHEEVTYELFDVLLLVSSLEKQGRNKLSNVLQKLREAGYFSKSIYRQEVTHLQIVYR